MCDQTGLRVREKNKKWIPVIVGLGCLLWRGCWGTKSSGVKTTTSLRSRRHSVGAGTVNAVKRVRKLHKHGKTFNILHTMHMQNRPTIHPFFSFASLLKHILVYQSRQCRPAICAPTKIHRPFLRSRFNSWYLSTGGPPSHEYGNAFALSSSS